MSQSPIVIEQGRPAPGGWSTPEGPGEPVWRGPVGWGTRHGTAVLHRIYGLPSHVEDALTDDGRRNVEASFDAGVWTWRRKANHIAGGWSTGEVTIGPDEIVFRDDAGQIDRSVPDLVRDVARDPAFMARLQDDAFAAAFYEHTLNREYRFVGHPSLWGEGLRTIAATLCGLRGQCEDPYLFTQGFLAGPQGAAEVARFDAEIDAHLTRLGWTRLSPAERDIERKKAITEVAACEGRPAGECPLWASGFEPRDPVNPRDGLLMAARAGKVALAEYRHIEGRL